MLVVGDNGTQGNAVEPPFLAAHGKGTLFEGGIRVPLIVAGPAVAPAARGRVCEALVQTVDLFPTVTELCGVPAHAVVPSEVVLDGRSLVPLLADPDAPSRHPALYCELFKPNHADPADYTAHRRAARNGRYKLVRNELDGLERLFDLELDPFEQRDLLEHKPELSAEERRAYRDLDRWIRAMH